MKAKMKLNIIRELSESAAINMGTAIRAIRVLSAPEIDVDVVTADVYEAIEEAFMEMRIKRNDEHYDFMGKPAGTYIIGEIDAEYKAYKRDIWAIDKARQEFREAVTE